MMWAFTFYLARNPAPRIHFFDSIVNRKETLFTFFTTVLLLSQRWDMAILSPASEIARSLALLEAVIGQIYLVVLVARLVGVHIAQSCKGESQ